MIWLENARTKGVERDIRISVSANRDRIYFVFSHEAYEKMRKPDRLKIGLDNFNNQVTAIGFCPVSGGGYKVSTHVRNCPRIAIQAAQLTDECKQTDLSSICGEYFMRKNVEEGYWYISMGALKKRPV